MAHYPVLAIICLVYPVVVVLGCSGGGGGSASPLFPPPPHLLCPLDLCHYMGVNNSQVLPHPTPARHLFDSPVRLDRCDFVIFVSCWCSVLFVSGTQEFFCHSSLQSAFYQGTLMPWCTVGNKSHQVQNQKRCQGHLHYLLLAFLLPLVPVVLCSLCLSAPLPTALFRSLVPSFLCIQQPETLRSISWPNQVCDDPLPQCHTGAFRWAP